MKSDIFIGSMSDSYPMIPTVEYGNIDTSGVAQGMQDNITFHQNRLNALFGGNYYFESEKDHTGPSIEVSYPKDAHGNQNRSKENNGLLRLEQLATFSHFDPDTQEVEYIARGRPTLPGSNTPGKLDPGVLSHGGIAQAGMVNAWRYVADKFGVNDAELTQEQYLQYLRDHPFPDSYFPLKAGSFILANGSNARNAKKLQDGKQLEPRTSGLMLVSTVPVSSDQFTDILHTQASAPGDIIYQSVSLSENTDISDFTPKHQAVHSLLYDIKDQIAQAVTASKAL